MKYDKFRRSKNVEDYSDPDTPVEKSPPLSAPMSINDMLKMQDSQLAKDAGLDDIAIKKKDGA